MLSKKNIFFFILLLFLLPQDAKSQYTTCVFSLSGTVIDNHDKTPLSFSTVYIKELEKGVITSEDGSFQLENLCEGQYTLIIGHIGCTADTQVIAIKKNVKRIFYLEHHSEELSEFSVVEKNTNPMETVIKRTLSIEEMNQARGKSLGESLKQLPGVTTLNTGNNVSKPIIHGMHSDRILILNNGIRQEGQQWGSEHAPEIDPFVANNLTVIKGAESIRYGANAVGGVILVEPKPLKDSAGIDGEVHLIGSTNGRQGTTSATLNGNSAKLNGLNWRVQGSLKRGGNLKTPNYFMKNTGVREYNFSWGIGYNKEKIGVEVFYSQFNTDIGIFSAAHIGNLTDLQVAFDAEFPLDTAGFSYNIGRPSQHIQHELVKLKTYLFTGNAGKLNLTYARQYNLREEYDKHLPRNNVVAALNKPELQFEITTHTADLFWEQNRRKKWKIAAGVSGIYQANTTEGREFIPNFEKYNTGIYVLENWLSNNYKLKLEAGLRYDYTYQKAYKWQGNVLLSPNFSYQTVSGSIGAAYKFSDNLTIGFHTGTAFRPPNMSELFSNGVHHGAAAVEFGDTNLVLEKAWNNTLSVGYTGKKLTVLLDVYANYIANFIYLAPELPPTLTIRGAFPTFKYKQTNASFSGIDVNASYQLSKNLMYLLKGSLLRAYNHTANEWLFGMPADRIENGLQFKPNHFSLLKATYIGISWQYVFKQTRFEQGSDFVNPPNAYNLVNVQAGTEVPFISKKTPLTLGIEMNNLFNTVYRDYLNRFRYFSDEIGRNFTFKLNYKF